MPGIRPAPGEIPQKAMAYILQGLCTISYGEIGLMMGGTRLETKKEGDPA